MPLLFFFPLVGWPQLLLNLPGRAAAVDQSWRMAKLLLLSNGVQFAVLHSTGPPLLLLVVAGSRQHHARQLLLSKWQVHDYALNLISTAQEDVLVPPPPPGPASATAAAWWLLRCPAVVRAPANLLLGSSVPQLLRFSARACFAAAVDAAGC